jgi:putative oxygen-independent coproporphyrinogen III oxidase
MLEQPPLSLYIHIPWCIKKCPYCDFNSHQVNGSFEEDNYTNKLYDDFLVELNRLGDKNRELQSIFIGGGTPSLFKGDSFHFLFTRIKNHLKFSENIEITIEANPGAVDSEKFRAYFDAGINRISLGVQSFDDKYLSKLGRIHTSNDAIKSIEVAKSAGFENINLDIMHGLPEQSIEAAVEDLRIAIEQSPSHISWYQFTIEPNTYFYNYPPKLPSENIQDGIFEKGTKILSTHAFSQYEVSAFAQNSRKSFHNHNYWSFGDYLGIGSGAHGKLTLLNENKLIRTNKPKRPDHYMNHAVDSATQLREISTEERTIEFLMNALRLKEGFSQNLFEVRTGNEFSVISSKKVDSLKPIKSTEKISIAPLIKGIDSLTLYSENFCKHGFKENALL